VWDWRWYVRVAERLRPKKCADDYELGRVRSAISRAYYAAYNVTKAYMRANKHEIDAPSNSHKPYWEAIEHNTSLSADENEVGIKGKHLMSLRINADYHDPEVDPSMPEHAKAKKLERHREKLMANSEAAITVAHEIFRLLKQPFPTAAESDAAKKPQQ